MTQLSRRAILRGAAPAALSVAAAAALPAMASGPSGGNPTIAELFAEWRTLKEEEGTRDRHMAAVQATMPAEFRISEGTPYRFPAEFPPHVLAAYNAWQKANCPADWEDQTNELGTLPCRWADQRRRLGFRV